MRPRITATASINEASVGRMGRTGNTNDNDDSESIFKTLKHEKIYAQENKAMEDVVKPLPLPLKVYNRRRLHFACGYEENSPGKGID